MSDPDERPRWSFTWMLRIQRVGRRTPPVDRNGRPLWWLQPLQWLLAVIVILGALALVWAGVLPR